MVASWPVRAHIVFPIMYMTRIAQTNIGLAHSQTLWHARGTQLSQGDIIVKRWLVRWDLWCGLDTLV